MAVSVLVPPCCHLCAEISMLYGTISEYCSKASCPVMAAGDCRYLWADKKITKPIECSGQCAKNRRHSIGRRIDARMDALASVSHVIFFSSPLSSRVPLLLFVRLQPPSTWTC